MVRLMEIEKDNLACVFLDIGDVSAGWAECEGKDGESRGRFRA